MPYTISLSFASTVCSFSCGFCRFIVCVFLLYFSLVWAWKFAFIRNRKIFFAGTSRWPLDNNIAWFNVSSCCMTCLMRTFFSFCCTLANIFVSYYGEKWSNSTTLTVNAKRNWRMKSKYIKSTSIWRKKEEKKIKPRTEKELTQIKLAPYLQSHSHCKTMLKWNMELACVADPIFHCDFYLCKPNHFPFVIDINYAKSERMSEFESEWRLTNVFLNLNMSKCNSIKAKISHQN